MLSLLILILIIGCNEEIKYPVTTIRCTNQKLWDTRIDYRDFSCVTSNTAKFPIFRNCTATKEHIDVDRFTMTNEILNTICIEECTENCDKGWNIVN